ncbi:hypothetical protein FRB94_003566 [Tulasnella sp. JGI-2019a]|nr:hypothetical protein FRB94_003566 [Tulasnella sp. JGI-2019a]KAG9025689.1 hypothetical protein FRB95_009906 [Tulasnella sp. JGI-2019a]
MLPLAGPSTGFLPNQLYSTGFTPPQHQQAQQQLSSTYSAYLPSNSILNSMAQMPTMDVNAQVDMTNNSMNGTGNAPNPNNTFYPYDMHGPPPPQVSPFMATLSQVATQVVPNIETLARSALDGINRAYEFDTDPAQTAASLQALRAALGNLYDILKESGVGALPLNPEPVDHDAIMRSGINGAQDPRLEALTEQVNAIFKEGKAARERATVVLDMMQASSQAGMSAQMS